MLDAAQIALFDLPDPHIALIPRDTGGTSAGATAAAQDAVSQGAKLIIGPLTAAEVEGIKPVAQARNVPVLAFSTVTKLAGNGTYLLGFLPSQGVARLVAYAHDQNIQHIAMLAPNSAYGHVIADALKDALAAQQTTPANTVFFDPSSPDFVPVVRSLVGYDTQKANRDDQRRQLAKLHDPASQEALKKLNDAAAADPVPFDAVLLPEGGDELKAILPLLPYYGVDPAKIHYLGTGLWDDPTLLTEPELQNAWYPAPDPAGRADFEKRFTDLYGHAPPRLSSLAYDAVALTASLIHVGQVVNFSQDALTNPSGFTGLDGIFRLLPSGLVERGLAVLEIQRTGPVVASPAPQSFPGPGI